MKNFLKNWQGIISTSLVLLAFCLMPVAFAFLRVTSGTIDWAYLQALAFSTVVFFAAILAAWVAMKCDWSIFTEYIVDRDFNEDWHHLQPIQRVIIFKATIFILILFYILCFFALPKP